MQTTKTSTWLFLLAFVLVFYGMGASFMESFVNYPTWRLIGPNEFKAFHQAASPLIIGWMVIPMLIGTAVTVALIWFRPAPVPRWAIWVSVALQMITWISTATIQLPIQFQLSSNGLSVPLIDYLILTNVLLRRIPMLINTVLFLWMMTLMLRANFTDSGPAASAEG